MTVRRKVQASTTDQRWLDGRGDSDWVLATPRVCGFRRRAMTTAERSRHEQASAPVGSFVGSWLGQLVSQSIEFTSEQQQHGATFTWGEFLPHFLASTLENWQSEWLQLVFQAVFLLGAKHLLFRADAEDVEQLERKIDELRAAQGIDTPA